MNITVDGIYLCMSEGERQHMANKLAKHGTFPQGQASEVSLKEAGKVIRDFVINCNVEDEIKAARAIGTTSILYLVGCLKLEGPEKT